MAETAKGTATDLETLPKPLIEKPGWILVSGVVMIVFGVLAILVPQVTTLAVELVIGWLFLLSGLIYAWSAFSLRSVWKMAGATIVAVLSIVVGCLLLFNPFEGVLTLTVVMIAFFFASGVMKIYYGIQNRPLSGWGWAIVSGIASIVLGGLLLAGWPSTAAWALGLLFGVDLLLSGCSLLVIYTALKASAAPATARRP